MKKIGLGLSAASAGVSSYSIEIFKALNDASSEMKIVPMGDTQLLMNGNVPKFRAFRESGENFVDIHCKIEGIDLIHFCFQQAVKVSDAIPYIMTIHDITPMLYPHWYGGQRSVEQYKGPIREAASRAKHIITISESSKRDIMENFKIPEEKISVVYNGLKHDFVRMMNYACEGKEKRNYILSVCSLIPNKNIFGLIQGFRHYCEKFHDEETQLFLVGQVDDKEKVRLKEQADDIGKRITFTGYVAENELAELFIGAKCFIYPSFYEGFGLPVLEAMAFGKAVITSATSSLPEVGGDAVCYCNPYEIETISDALYKVLQNDSFRKELELKGLKRAAFFSYEKAAEQLLQVYRKILG